MRQGSDKEWNEDFVSEGWGDWNTDGCEGIRLGLNEGSESLDDGVGIWKRGGQDVEVAAGEVQERVERWAEPVACLGVFTGQVHCDYLVPPNRLGKDRNEIWRGEG